MTLYVLRHAIAEDARPGQSDSTRQLTETGRNRCRRVLAQAKRVKVQPTYILTSPYDRAAQTAEIARLELGFDDELVTTNALVPFVGVQELWSAIRDYAVGGDVMIVGHNPQLSMLVMWLLGARSDALWLKKSGLAALGIGDAGPHPRAELSWLMTPGSVGR